MDVLMMIHCFDELEMLMKLAKKLFARIAGEEVAS
jgi:hypothetical protein